MQKNANILDMITSHTSQQMYNKEEAILRHTHTHTQAQQTIHLSENVLKFLRNTHLTN